MYYLTNYLDHAPIRQAPEVSSQRLISATDARPNYAKNVPIGFRTISEDPNFRLINDFNNKIDNFIKNPLAEIEILFRLYQNRTSFVSNANNRKIVNILDLR